MARCRGPIYGASRCLSLPLIRGILFILILAVPLSFLWGAQATPRAANIILGNVSPGVAHSQLVGNVNGQQTLSLSITMNLNHLSELKQYISAVSTPGSYLYHHYLHPSEFAARFGPSASDLRQVTDYLQGQGFSITHALAGEQVVDFSGTVAQVEQAFGVQIAMYRTQDGTTGTINRGGMINRPPTYFYANTAAPRVPSVLRPLITNISGLNNTVRAVHPPIRLDTLTPRRQPRNVGAVACPGPGSLAAKYYTPAQFASAYNFSGFYNAGYHGEGQSVALFELDSYTPGDISGYEACFDTNAPTRIQTTLIDGGPSGQGPGGLEVDLDMEVLLGMLPGLSNLFVYEAPNTDTGYNDEWMQILRDDIPVVSTSWGMCEPNLSATDITAEQQFFMQAAAQGQSLMAASGDNGAYDCGDSNRAVDDPASNPYVTGVGGTHLLINGDGSYNSESGWSNSPNTGSGSGGGISQLWSMPSYQSGPGVINSSSSGSPCHAAAGQYCREVPDVSFDADPNTGYIVYCTVSGTGCQASAPFAHVGGTSLAAPMEAAVIALTDQYALAHGGNNLGFLNPTIYMLLNTSTSYSSAFHDVTSGSNLYYVATAGYDMVTGVGSTNAYHFAQAAVSLTGARNVPASKIWYFAEGHLGNNFQEYLTLENPSVDTMAHVVVNYLLRGKPFSSQMLTLNPSSRTTVNVNGVLGVNYSSPAGQDVSLAITSDVSIVAERPMYFTYLGSIAGGSDIVGVTQPGQHFTFANGESAAGYATYLTVLNPLGQSSATVTATYYSGGTMIGQSTINVPAGQRNTIFVNGAVASGQQFLIQVDSNVPIVVERPMYFHLTMPGISGSVQGGSSLLGATPAATWYFPNGSTGRSGVPAQENLILANPDANGSGTAANVSILYALANGTTKTVSVSIPAKSLLVENVNTDVGPGALVAMKVSSTNGIGIVAEQQQFFNAPSLVPTPTGVEVLGVTPGTQGLSNVYSFAEGHEGNSFSQYVTLFNPNSVAISVAVTYFVTRGPSQYVSQEQVNIPAMGVVQVDGNGFLNIPASSAGGVAADTSLVIATLPGGGSGTALPVVAERSLYFIYLGTVPGATSVVGYSGS